MLAESEPAESTPGDEPLGPPASHTAAEGGTREGLAADRLFSAALGHERVLSRSEEEVLARRIARARARIRAVLRGARTLSRAALAGSPRGVVRPEHDFREREAVVILRYAERRLARGDGSPVAGWSRPRLQAFVRELRGALTEYRALRDQMVRANMRLVAMLARRYHHPTLTFLDLFQEGTFGLMRAVEKFQPARGVKFSTYASWWIWQQLGRSADLQGDLVRTPVHWNQLRRRMGRAPDDLGATLADAEGIASERFATMTQAFRYVSMDTAADEDRPLGAALPSAVADPETQVVRATLGVELAALVDTLPPREQFVVRRRFGLDGADPHTLEVLSGDLGVSRERVRQLEMRALARLRKACAERELQDYLR
jgi:RNA polymerase sigma factor (sigma-70 family)